MLQRMPILLTPVMHQVRPYSQMDQDPPTPSCLYHTSIAIASGKVDTQESRDKIILSFFFLILHGEYTTSNNDIPPFCLYEVALGWKVRLNQTACETPTYQPHPHVPAYVLLIP